MAAQGEARTKQEAGKYKAWLVKNWDRDWLKHRLYKGTQRKKRLEEYIGDLNAKEFVLSSEDNMELLKIFNQRSHRNAIELWSKV